MVALTLELIVDMATMTEDLMMNMIDKCPEPSVDVEGPEGEGPEAPASKQNNY